MTVARIQIARLTDLAPTDDEALNALRQDTINTLGRQLRPEESFALAAGEPLPDDDGVTRYSDPFVPWNRHEDRTPEEQIRDAESGRA